MTTWKTHLVGGTLAALQARQMALEAQMKVNAKDAASRVVQRHGKDKGWSEEDIKNVMGALGLA
jgi:hypothetical protein